MGQLGNDPKAAASLMSAAGQGGASPPSADSIMPPAVTPLPKVGPQPSAKKKPAKAVSTIMNLGAR